MPFGPHQASFWGPTACGSSTGNRLFRVRISAWRPREGVWGLVSCSASRSTVLTYSARYDRTIATTSGGPPNLVPGLRTKRGGRGLSLRGTRTRRHREAARTGEPPNRDSPVLPEHHDPP